MDAVVADAIAHELSERKSTHLEAQVEEYRTTINRLHEQNAQFQEHVTANLMQMRDHRNALDIAASAAEDHSFAEHLAEEWGQLRGHQKLADASFEGNVLTLRTTDDIRLHCEDRADTRWLGAFVMTLDLASGRIRLENQNTRRGGRDHPHVVNGQPCFGGDHAAFTQLHANGDLYVLFEMLVQYLETLNLNDEYGRYGAYWFEQPDERPLDGEAVASAMEEVGF